MVAAKPLAMALAIGLFNSVAQAGGIDNGWGPDTTEFYCNVQKSDEKCGLNVLLTDQICRAYCRCDSARDKPEIKCTAYGSCSSDTMRKELCKCWTLDKANKDKLICGKAPVEPKRTPAPSPPLSTQKNSNRLW